MWGSFDLFDNTTNGTSTFREIRGYVSLFRDEASGSNELATTSLLSKSGETAFTSTNTVRGAINAKADSSVLSKTSGKYSSTNTVEMAIESKVSASDFGTIAYAGLDGSDMSVYPTSYRKGGTPSLPKPTKPGSEFLGWTWGGQGAPTTDANTIKGAFAEGNAVTLTANWSVPKSNYFYTLDEPLDTSLTGSDQQFSEIEITLAAEPRTLAELTFRDNGLADLVYDTSQVYMQVNGVSGGWEGTRRNVALRELSDGSYGINVILSIPNDNLREDAAVTSYAPGSAYVTGCFRAEYTFA